MALSCVRANNDMVITNAAFAHNIGTGDFTVGGWINLTTATGFGACFSTHRNEPWANALALLPEGVGSSNWGIIIGGSFINFGTNLTTGLYHLAVIRSGTGITGVLDGVSDGTGTSSYNIPNNTVSFGGCSPDNNYHDGGLQDWFVCAAAIPIAKIKGMVDARMRAGTLIAPYSPRGYWPLDRPGDEVDNDFANGDFGGRELIGKYHLILHTSPATAPVWMADFVDLNWGSTLVTAEAPSGGTTVEGPAAGVLSFSASANLTAVGSLAAAAPLSVSASANLTGTAALTAAAPLSVSGAGAGISAVEGTASAAMSFAGSGALTGIAALTAAAPMSFSGGGALTGTGALAAAAGIAFSTSATFSEPGNLAAAAILAFGGSANATGTGALAAAGPMGFAGSAVLAAAGLANYGGYRHVAAAFNPAGTTSLLVKMRATTGTVTAQLYDETGGTVVAGSNLTTASSSLVWLESAPLALADGHDYCVQVGPVGAGEIQRAEVVCQP